MHWSISPGRPAAPIRRGELRDAYRQTRRRPRRWRAIDPERRASRSPGPAAAVRCRSASNPRLRQHRLAARRCRSPTRGSPGSPHLVFPGLRPRRAAGAAGAGPRAGRDPGRRRDPAGRGAGREPVLAAGQAASSVAGEVARRHDPEQDRELSRLGIPPGTPTGSSGLELAFNRRLAGRPGGELVAVTGERRPPGGRGARRERARQPGKPVHTTIDPTSSRPPWRRSAARYGGVAVLDARDGSVLALAGIAFSGPQPRARPSR